MSHPDTNVVNLNPQDQRKVDERFKEDFRKVFAKRVEADQQGHRGDIVPRAQNYEQ